MNDILFGLYTGPETKENEPAFEERLKEFDPNEGSLSEGGEYMDDALRMVEQPLMEIFNKI